MKLITQRREGAKLVDLLAFYLYAFASLREAVSLDSLHEYSGSVYKSISIEGNKVRLSFDHSKGLNAKANEKGETKLMRFKIAGAEKVRLGGCSCYLVALRC